MVVFPAISSLFYRIKDSCAPGNVRETPAVQSARHASNRKHVNSCTVSLARNEQITLRKGGMNGRYSVLCIWYALVIKCPFSCIFYSIVD